MTDLCPAYNYYAVNKSDQNCRNLASLFQTESSPKSIKPYCMIPMDPDKTPGTGTPKFNVNSKQKGQPTVKSKRFYMR